MKEIIVEGYKALVERTDEGFFASIPDLPGCSIQAGKLEDVEGELKKAIASYLLELSSKKPAGRLKNGRNDPGAQGEDPAKGIRK
jgi:predicted RNase H-like HicB family nuclease